MVPDDHFTAALYESYGLVIEPGILDLGLIPGALRSLAIQAIGREDIVGFLGYASNELSIQIVVANAEQLRDRGLLERAIVTALIATRTANFRDYPRIRELLRFADRERLLAGGDVRPPSRGPFTLYRGVGGKGPARRVRGYSWTSKRETAEPANPKDTGARDLSPVSFRSGSTPRLQGTHLFLLPSSQL